MGDLYQWISPIADSLSQTKGIFIAVTQLFFGSVYTERTIRKHGVYKHYLMTRAFGSRQTKKRR